MLMPVLAADCSRLEMEGSGVGAEEAASSVLLPISVSDELVMALAMLSVAVNVLQHCTILTFTY